MKSMLRAVERSTATRVWSVKRKLLANILPLLCGAPFLGLAIWLWVGGLGWYSVGAAAASLVVPAVSLNWLGLVGNREMRRTLSSRLKPSRDAIFVGFSRPGYFDILDPHEDLGFLEIENDCLRITGELSTVRLLRNGEVRVGYEFNPHSLLGLGRWVAIKGSSATGPVRVNFEPRQRGSLRANRALSAELRNRLAEWRESR